MDATGSLGLTLDFSQLQTLRPGYGYVTEDDPSVEDPAPEDEGVWLVDPVSGEETLILSLAALGARMPVAREEGAAHYVNHLSFNPSGKVRVVEEEVRVSHFTWRDDRTLIATAHPSIDRL